jgi:hypothetical protein
MYFITTDENINASRLSSEDHLKNTIRMTIFYGIVRCLRMNYLFQIIIPASLCVAA